MAKLIETVFMERKPVVDRNAGTISGVKLLGAESRNGRRYTKRAMESAAKLYKGAKNYVNHDRSEAGMVERGVEEWAAVVTDAKVESDGVYGTLKLRKQSPHYEPLMEAAEDADFYKAFGMSHVANGDSRMDNGTELVEDVTEVVSVDFVTTPATTNGLSESQRKSKAKPNSVKATIESLPEGTARTRLVEMLDAGYIDGDMPMAGEEKPPADPLSQMSSLVKELITMLGETLKALAMKKDTPPPAPPAPEEPPMADEPTKPKPEEQAVKDAAFESLQRENAELKAKSLLLESGRDATEIRVKALASAAEADQKALLESWPQLEEAARPLRSPALIESEAADFPRDPEKFAASLR